MSIAVYQSSHNHIMQINYINSPSPLKLQPPPPPPQLPPSLHPFKLNPRRYGAGKLRTPLLINASVCPPPSSSCTEVDDDNAISTLYRCFYATPSSAPVMKGKFGSFGATTLEKPKFDTAQKQTVSSPQEIAIDDGGDDGGDGGDIGNDIGGGGGGASDDDDNYFADDFDDGDEGGLFRKRIIVGALFGRKFVDAVLNEWQKTMLDLPAGFRQAYEMGLISSAEMVNFLEINARPTTRRFISRLLRPGLSRGFIGRMIADPAFLYKLLLEQAATISCSISWEIKNRKERIKQEWDLALINVLTVAACNAIIVWSLAPCHSYGNTFRFNLQNTLQKLPNNIFENSYLLREFDLQKRIHSFLYKAAEMCMVGTIAGAAQGALANLSASRKEGRLSVTLPSVSSNALAYGAFTGLYANLRYQLLCGIDKALIHHFDVIGVALFFSTTMRLMNVQLGETSRLAWLGVEVDPLAHSDDSLKVYNRPSECVNQTSPKWFISKKAIVSGLGLLGIKQQSSDSAIHGEVSTTPKPRRKRVVKRKIATSRV